MTDMLRNHSILISTLLVYETHPTSLGIERPIKNQNITQQTTNNKNFSVLFIFGNDHYLLDLVRKLLTGIPPLHD